MTLETLAAIEDIRRLKARYFRFMDTKDWAGWRTVFTDDATMLVDTAVSTRGEDGKPMPLVTGGDAIIAYVRAIIDAAITVHHGHMPEIEILSSESARGIWAMRDIVQRPGGPTNRGYGHYYETYRRSPDKGWQIATLHLKRIRRESYAA
ncbi:MAG: nuclear transport factor 2 family protein [Caulobacterales bacterium]